MNRPGPGGTLMTGAIAFLLLAAAPSGPAARASTPPGQVITVEATTSLSRTAVLRTWQLKSDGRYQQVFPAVVAFVGVNGVRPTREGLGRTPVGVFTLTEGFGNEPNPGTRLPYFVAGPDDSVGRESRNAEVQRARAQRRLAWRRLGEPVRLGLRLRPRRGHQLQQRPRREGSRQRLLLARKRRHADARLRLDSRQSTGAGDALARSVAAPRDQHRRGPGRARARRTSQPVTSEKLARPLRQGRARSGVCRQGRQA